MLDCLVTDAWVPPGSFFTKLCSRESKLRERFHTELRDAPVKAFTSSFLLFETAARARGLADGQKYSRATAGFNVKSSPLSGSDRAPHDSQPILLSYSYTALEPFRYAKSRGWKTVLAQIDPGPEEEKIVAEETARVPKLAGSWRPAPAEYWTCWREECEIADRIIVNSGWSREGLIRGGVPAEKISIIPLVYQLPDVGGRRQKSDRRDRIRSGSRPSARCVSYSLV